MGLGNGWNTDSIQTSMSSYIASTITKAYIPLGREQLLVIKLATSLLPNTRYVFNTALTVVSQDCIHSVFAAAAAVW